MKTLIATLLFFSSNTFAAPVATGAAKKTTPNYYELNVDWSVKGTKMPSSKIVTKEDEIALVKTTEEKQNYFFEVTPKPNENGKGIFMQFKVGTINAKGEKQILSTPQIIALENEKATISVSDNAKAELISVSVLAKTTKKPIQKN